jgi:5'-AMP-activated protein kinase catalytic alpha subunit
MQGNQEYGLENYVLGRTLGRGTFASVKFATHRLTKEKVAIKIINKLKMTEPDDMERLARELKIMQEVSHPHIVQMYEVLQTPRDLHLVLEFASGGELFKYISTHHRVRETEACRFFQQALSGLEYLHSIGIAHRDLKPENLLLDHHKNIKIADFGLSNYYAQGARLNTACGSPCYAAPEKIAGKPYDAAKADLWSMGVILYTMLVGALPFDDPNTHKLYKKIAAGHFYMPDYLSEHGKDLLLSMIHTNPTTRASFAKLKSHPWYSTFNQSILPGIIPGTDVPVDVNILKQLREYDIDIEYARSCVTKNLHNPVTTAYYLLVRKHLAMGGNLHPTTFLPKISSLPRDRLLVKSKNLSLKASRISNRESEGNSLNSSMARAYYPITSRVSIKQSLSPKRKPASKRKLGLRSNWTLMRGRQRKPSMNLSMNDSVENYRYEDALSLILNS